MRRFLWAGILLLSAAAVLGQDELKPDQLKKMYDEALVQLNKAQDRKNELQTENDRLNARLADLQKQLDATKAKLDDANREAGEFAQKTFYLRAHYAAWRMFIERFPNLKQQWEIYLEDGSSSPRKWPDVMDPDWPLE